MGAKFKAGKNPIPGVKKAQERGIGLAAEHVLGEARKVVPFEEGTLEGSGATDTEQTTDGVRAVVSFDTPYATIQHEDMSFQHDAGRTAKYLETPLNAESDQVLNIVAKAVKGEL